MEPRILDNSRKLKVLVAEDDSFQRLAIDDILGILNYEGRSF